MIANRDVGIIHTALSWSWRSLSFEREGSPILCLEICCDRHYYGTIVNTLRCNRVKSHRLILVAELNGRIFNRSIVQAKGNLLQIAPAACSIGVIQVGVDPVVPDHGGQGRTCTEAFWREFGQELGHEMIVALDIVAHHALRRDARTADCRRLNRSSRDPGENPNRISLNGSRVSSRIGPGSFADEFKRALLKRPVHRRNTERGVSSSH